MFTRYLFLCFCALFFVGMFGASSAEAKLLYKGDFERANGTGVITSGYPTNIADYRPEVPDYKMQEFEIVKQPCATG